MDVESGQLGEVPVQAQGHEEARVLIGQLGVLGLVVQHTSYHSCLAPHTPAWDWPFRSLAKQILPLGVNSSTSKP